MKTIAESKKTQTTHCSSDNCAMVAILHQGGQLALLEIPHCDLTGFRGGDHRVMAVYNDRGVEMKVNINPRLDWSIPLRNDKQVTSPS